MEERGWLLGDDEGGRGSRRRTPVGTGVPCLTPMPALQLCCLLSYSFVTIGGTGTGRLDLSVLLLATTCESIRTWR